ncbi:monofunctional biosynthetic peptidoglycan transglycosylase [Salinisphaera sp. T31B1]|uniref:monofunctional biosynthetic peptidoglycan transglycosylase n=1 Tax=Salinisphaera sp. T31B1 TaxID=727963 RepID=UPI00333F1834
MIFLRNRFCRYLLILCAAVALAPAALILLFRWVNPPVTAYMLRVHFQVQQASDSDGPTLYQQWVGLDSMAACMPLAAVASEDQTFPTHHGFVWSAIGDALADNASGSTVRGASTISQQTAKNLFLWPAKSYVRKAIEAYLTVWIEVLWPKRRILEVYLNIAQFDDRVFGVGAAADRLFGTTAAKLSTRQCAALAAVLPAPERYDAASPGSFVQGRIAWIERQMRHLGSGYLTDTLAR